MVEIRIAEQEDLKEILELQYLAFRENAIRAGKWDIQPLTQTYDEIVEEFKEGVFLKACDGSRIVGSVRTREDNGTVYIGKLIVHPDTRRRGYGTMLLKAVEDMYPGKRFELFTGSEDEDNLRLYGKNGYKEFDRRAVNPKVSFVYLEKIT